jgi:hypothetical protein
MGKRVPTSKQDYPEPDWEKLRELEEEYKREASFERRLAYFNRNPVEKAKRSRLTVRWSSWDEFPTSAGIIRNNRLRKRRRPPNLDEMELAAYYAEPSHVILCKRKNNAHWIW